MTINKNILIAEDELVIAKVLQMQLERTGYQVENVPNGNDVFNKVNEMKPIFIILDVQLKNNTSGLDAGKKIREAGINTPIIFTTGNSYDHTVQLVKDIEHAKVLTKPVLFEQLLAMIKQF